MREMEWGVVGRQSVEGIQGEMSGRIAPAPPATRPVAGELPTDLAVAQRVSRLVEGDHRNHARC